MDLPGTISLLGAFICYLLALQWGGVTKQWSSLDVIGCLIGWILLTVLFLIIEYHQKDRALLVGRILKQRNIAALSAFIFLYTMLRVHSTIMEANVFKSQFRQFLASIQSTHLFPSHRQRITHFKWNPESPSCPHHR